MGFSKGETHSNSQVEYNMRIMRFNNKDFGRDKKNKVLLIGNSYARDWGNILLESSYGSLIDLSYIKVSSSFINEINEDSKIRKKWSQADYIFLSDLDIYEFSQLKRKFKLNNPNVKIIGVKNFGVNNGIFYNKSHDADYCNQRTEIGKKFLIHNEILKKQWGNKYIDILGILMDKSGKVAVFNSECEFISQDCLHLTKSGAKYLSEMLIFDHGFFLNHD